MPPVAWPRTHSGWLGGMCAAEPAHLQLPAVLLLLPQDMLVQRDDKQFVDFNNLHETVPIANEPMSKCAPLVLTSRLANKRCGINRKMLSCMGRLHCPPHVISCRR